jgi:NADPH:quinone reductase-like Zn-dependent oxidoreductase
LNSFRAKTVKFLGPRQCVIEDVEIDPSGLRPGEFVLETEFSVVSAGTELANYAAIDPGVFEPGSWNAYPSCPGYGAVGRVVAIAGGSGATEGIPSDGERVFAFTKHASFSVGDVNRFFVVPLEESDDGPLMCLMRIAGVAMTILRRAASLQLGASAVVVGLGMVGNFAAQLLRLAGLSVTGFEPNPYRANIARRVGIDQVIETPLGPELDLVRTGLAATADLVIEASGQTPLAVAASPLARYGGQMLLLGTPRASHSTDVSGFLRDVQLRGLTVTGASEWTLDPKGRHGLQSESWSIEEGYNTIRHLLLTGQLRGKELISEMVPPDAAPTVYEDLLGANRQLLGVIFDWAHQPPSDG